MSFHLSKTTACQLIFAPLTRRNTVHASLQTSFHFLRKSDNVSTKCLSGWRQQTVIILSPTNILKTGSSSCSQTMSLDILTSQSPLSLQSLIPCYLDVALLLQQTYRIILIFYSTSIFIILEPLWPKRCIP